MKTDSSFSDVQLIKCATYSAVIVAIFLTCGKFFAWRITGSVSLQASLIDSLLDAAASFINLIAVQQALKPADDEHRFGHGKVESLAGLAQSTFIAASALWLLLDITNRLWYPQPLEATHVGSLMMILALLATLGLVIFQRYVVQRTRSLAIMADSLHYKSDLLTNGGVLVSLNLYPWLGWERLDPLVGAAIAAYILYTSWQIAKKSLDILMDRELPDEKRQEILNMVLAHPQVRGVHDLRTRSSGRYEFIQMHLDLDAQLSLRMSHAIGLEVTKQLKKKFPYAEILLHHDPIDVKFPL